MSRRILVIDDDRDIREVIRVSLEQMPGWEVSMAASGPEGVAKAIADKPDAIVLDLLMPELDGFATFRLLQAEDLTRDIPVVVLSTQSRNMDGRELAEMGIRAVLAKPFQPGRLAGQIAIALGW